jgi:hypothetical protein
VKLTNFFFPRVAKNNWALCKNFPLIFFLDAQICFGNNGNFMQPDHFGQIIWIERISLLPKIWALSKNLDARKNF